MGQNVSIDFIARTGGAIRDINKLNRAVGTQATKMEKVRAGVKRMTPVAIAGGAAIVGFGVKAVAAASDVSESINKAATIYGKSSQTIIDASKNAATEVGLSQSAYLEGVSTLGQFGKAAGLSGDDLAKFGTDFATLSADLASFNNTSPEEALEAIGATLRGETEPIRKYGVMINDAALKQKAMELGIYDGNGALNQQQKTLAASKLIMEQTTDAQGDFTKTQGGLANSQRILKAQFTDFMATLGRGLLPIVEKVMGALNKMTKWAREHPGLIKAIIGVFAGFVAVILAANIVLKIQSTLTKIDTAVKLIHTAVTKKATTATKNQTIAQRLLNVAMRMNPIGIIITAIAGFVAAIVIAYNKSETFRGIVQGVWEWLKTLGGWLVGVGATVFDGLKSGYEAIQPVIDTFVTAIKWIWETGKTAIEWYGKIGQAYFSGIKTAFELLSAPIDTVMDALAWIWDTGKKAVNYLKGKFSFSKLVSALGPVGTALSGIVGSLKWIWENAKNAFGAFGKEMPKGWQHPLRPGGPANPNGRSLQPMGRSTVNVNVVSGGDQRILVSEEQIARAVYRVLARSDARNGLEFA